MDHKFFFANWGDRTINDLSRMGGFTAEELCQAIEGRLLEKLASLGIIDYSAIKQRLIEELRVRPGHSEIHLSEGAEYITTEYAALIDTSEPKENG